MSFTDRKSAMFVVVDDTVRLPVPKVARRFADVVVDSLALVLAGAVWAALVVAVVAIVHAQ